MDIQETVPEKPAKRSVRRHNVERLKKSRSKNETAKGATGHRALIIAKTPAICSCAACGNPRKFFNEATIQERSADCLLRHIGIEE